MARLPALIYDDVYMLCNDLDPARRFLIKPRGAEGTEARFCKVSENWHS